MKEKNSINSLPRVAVIGTGTMGAAMAARLLASRFDVDVWSRHPLSTWRLFALGARSHVEVTDAVAEADVVISMLPTAAITAEVMFDAKGLCSMRRDAVWVQMATVGVSATEDFAAQVRAQRPDVIFVDAPVSGSRAPAESGQLLILASGAEECAQPLESVFRVLGRRTMWLGPIGAGSRVKLILNTWLAFQIEGAAEAILLANRLSMDPEELLEALQDNPIASPFAVAKLGKMIQGDYRAEFALDLALKDLDLVGMDAGIDAAPIAAAIAARWRQLVDHGFGGLDVSAAGQRLVRTA
jgi:3-hydroxyisobutyrate dehydrogenase